MPRTRPTAKKYFTPEQANRTLPLVRAIVSDIVGLVDLLQERQALLLKSRPHRSSLSAAHDEENRQRETEFARDAGRLEELVDELRRLGIELKGWDGLVDFPGLIEGREVCLCWKLGEPDVRFWHEVDAGYAGRQPLPLEADTALEIVCPSPASAALDQAAIPLVDRT